MSVSPYVKANQTYNYNGKNFSGAQLSEVRKGADIEGETPKKTFDVIHGLGIPAWLENVDPSSIDLDAISATIEASKSADTYSAKTSSKDDKPFDVIHGLGIPKSLENVDFSNFDAGKMLADARKSVADAKLEGAAEQANLRLGRG